MKFKKALLNIIHKYYPQILYKKNSYSQDGEDMLLASFYEGVKNYKGFYVDIGAHHPFRFSNTAHFYKKGWRGINIEPTPSLFYAFKKYRKKDINLNVGIGNGDLLTFYEFNEPAINSFDKEISMERHNDISTNYKIISEKSIQTLQLGDILEKYVFQSQIIDFFTIDVEGLDLEVLKSNNWEKFIPKFIFVECDFNIEAVAQDPIFQFLKEKGYNFVGRTKRTCLFQI